MGSFGTSGKSATRPTAATTSGRTQPGSRPGGPSSRPREPEPPGPASLGPGAPGPGISPGPAVPCGGTGRGPLPVAGTVAGTGEPTVLGWSRPAGAPARRHPYAQVRSSPTATITAAASWTYSDSLAGSRFSRIDRWVNTANGSGMPTALPDTVSLAPRPSTKATRPITVAVATSGTRR